MGGEGRDDKCMAISSHWEAWGGREAFMYDLAIVDLLDGSQERLTSDAKFDLYPVWSPDGSKIAFINTRYSQADPRKSHVWVYAHPRAYSLEIATMNANGSGVRHIDSNFEGEGVMLHLSPPAWSPDGQYLAFMNGRISGFASIWPPSIGSKEIYVAREDGTDLVRIGKSTAPPSWSPSGDKLAYATYKTNYPSDGQFEICVVKPNGTGVESIFRYYDSDPYGNTIKQVEWSPDGEHLLFVTIGRSGVHAVRADGSGDRTVYRDMDSFYWPEHRVEELSGPILAKWSPDGSDLRTLAEVRDGRFEVAGS